MLQGGSSTVTTGITMLQGGLIDSIYRDYHGGGRKLIDSIYRDYHAAGGLIGSIYRDYHAAGRAHLQCLQEITMLQWGSLRVSTGITMLGGGGSLTVSTGITMLAGGGAH